MPALNSLVTQPGNTQPPAVQGTSGTDQASGLQGLVQGGGGQQGAQQGPSRQETAALLQHMNFFRQRWAAMLKDPEAGTRNMRSEVYELMADALSDDYASLPDVMGQLKTLPTDPLEQKQWIEEHVQKNDKAMLMLLQHHAVAGQQQEQEMAPSDQDRSALVSGAVKRLKAAPKRSAQPTKGIPIRA
jgi:hypothetical protein